MNLSELLNFRTGNKFILTEDYDNKFVRLYGVSRSLTNKIFTLPKGLIFTIVGVNLNHCSQSMKCKIIRSKKIVDAIYKENNIDPKLYTAYRWSDEIDEDSYVRFSLDGEELFTFLNTVSVENFTSEYKRITTEIK